MKGHGSDGDAQSEVAVRGQAAHRAAVSASFLIFQFIDDLHGPDLWRAGNRARGEGCPEEIANRLVPVSVLRKLPRHHGGLSDAIQRYVAG